MQFWNAWQRSLGYLINALHSPSYSLNNQQMAEEENNFHNFSLYSSANFQDADETRPAGSYMEAVGGGNDAIQTLVNHSFQRHISEVVPTNSPMMVGLAGPANWRKRLREMMVRQNEQVLSFLLKPSTEHSILGPAEKALRRYAFRQDFDTNQIRPLRHILNDASGALMVQQEVEQRLAEKGQSTLQELRQQVGSIIELYKETGEKLLEVENQLKLRLEKMDKVQKRVGLIMELQTNESTPELIEALEHYLQTSFKDLTIESQYNSLLHLYQKHKMLYEAIQVFKTGNDFQSEPICTICLNEHVTTALDPCGHTFCSVCVRRLNNDCGICRTRIKNRLKVYFS